VKKTFLILLFFISLISSAQDNSNKSGETINFTDNKGLKQGYWEKKYENGNIRYTGRFKDNKPVGEFRRYYKSSSLQSVMVYDESGNYAKATFYYENGKIAATGKYFGTKKDNIWKYYSFYGGHLSNEESYNKGKKDGYSREYYSDSTVSQEKMWKNGVLNGPWRMWFPGEKIRLETRYVNGKLNGPFNTYYPDGSQEISGIYNNDIRIGKWTYREKETGKIKIINYIGGLPENQDEIDKSFEESMKDFELNKKKYTEPSIDDFRFGPKK
jgi:antitoxin component YwqK of YwqJK toxin-antitoxin module